MFQPGRTTTVFSLGSGDPAIEGKIELDSIKERERANQIKQFHDT